MEKLFKELAWKCFLNKLRFEYIPESNGVTVMDTHYQDVVSAGWADDESPIKVLKRMNYDVDEYLEVEELVDTEFNKPRGITEDEMKMWEAGHKKTDFM